MSDQTTRWENVKNRAEYLKNLRSGQHASFRPLVDLGIALCEEMDRLEERIKKLEVSTLPGRPDETEELYER
jgi:hypothetical protein